MIREAIAQILSIDQRVRIIQILQISKLREDFTIVLTPSVASYLQLTEDDRVRLKPFVDELKTAIRLAEKTKTISFYSAGLRSLPKSVADNVEQLFAGIWETK